MKHYTYEELLALVPAGGADPANIELIGANGLTVELKQTYDRLLLERAMPLLVHDQWGLKRSIPRTGSGGYGSNAGVSMTWRRLERVAASTTALTEGTPPTESRVTWTETAVTVQQYGQFTNLSDLVLTQALDPQLAEYSEMYGETMGISRDQVVRNVVVGGTTAQFADAAASRGAVSSGQRLDFAEIREAVATLRGNDARPVMDGKFIGIIHPDTEFDMFGDSDILTTLQNAGVRGSDNPLVSASIGDFYGVRWVVTSQADVGTSLGASGTDVYYTMILGAGYYGVTELDSQAAEIIVNPLGSAGAADPLHQVATIGYKTAVAAVRLNESFAVRIEHSSSLGTEDG